MGGLTFYATLSYIRGGHLIITGHESMKMLRKPRDKNHNKTACVFHGISCMYKSLLLTLSVTKHDHLNGDLNTLRPRQDGRYFADDVLKCIFFNENV